MPRARPPPLCPVGHAQTGTFERGQNAVIYVAEHRAALEALGSLLPPQKQVQRRDEIIRWVNCCSIYCICQYTDVDAIRIEAEC